MTMAADERKSPGCAKALPSLPGRPAFASETQHAGWASPTATTPATVGNAHPTSGSASKSSSAAPPLRILIALCGLHRVVRGAETALESVAVELAKLGQDVTLIGSGKAIADRPYRFIHAPCIRREWFERWPSLPLLRSNYVYEELTFAPGLLARYRPGDYDVTLTCSYPFTNWLLRRGRARHVFVTQNGDWMIRAGNREYRFFGCDGLVCTNIEYFERHRDRFAAELIPNGVDPDLFSPGVGPREELGLPIGEPVALMVSALIPGKRVLEGIAAAARAPGMHLAIAGDGPLRRQVIAEGNRLMPGRFRLMTLPRARMPGLYRAADVFLHMSRDEASANAYIEALASGLPIVTHDWPVTRWTLENTSLLVDAGDEAAVAAALGRALQMKTAEHERACRELVDRRFAWSSIAQGYLAFFRRLCEEAAPTQREPVGWALPTNSPGEKVGSAHPTNAPSPNVRGEGETVPSLDPARLGIVVIGRNEGERLKNSLRSVAGRTSAIVYVDSGSTDGSPAAAAELGADVVTLDTSIPFNAARARNRGIDRLLEIRPGIELVQFVDGDCEMDGGWLDAAAAALGADEKLAAVCGRRREKFPDRSIFNRIIDLEWDTPIGPAKSCGGDSMMRVAALGSVGGFDPTVVAGEEPELCQRLRRAGWKILRIDAEMTRHDAAMLSIRQWWRRLVRGGYGAADVATRFGGEGLFASQVRSARIWGLIYPLVVMAGACAAGFVGGRVAAGIVLAILLLVWPLQVARLALAGKKRRWPTKLAISWAFFTMLGKWPQLVGQIKYLGERKTSRGARLMEKQQRLGTLEPR